MKAILKTGCLLGWLVLATPTWAEPVFGRYLGVLKHEKLGKEQVAKLDFVVSRTNQNELELKAVLTLHFGDFKSGEYVSYHYDKVRYNILTGTLVFEELEQPVSIFVNRFQGGSLLGEVTTLWGGKTGQLVLKSQGEVTPSAPLIEPIWGEYKGSCGKNATKLQLYTFRSSSDTTHTGQPFAAYNIRANLLIDCTKEVCVNLRFTSGSYNFLDSKEQLSLVGPRQAMNCDVNGNFIHCKALEVQPSSNYDLSNCRFTRTSNETAEPRQLSPVEEIGSFGASDPAQEIKPEQFSAMQSGEYRGYVFHEAQGKYQAASLNLNVFSLGSGAEGGTKITSNAKLYFGDHQSPESIPYRFGERTYPNPITGPKNVVFERMSGNVDAIVQISESKNGVLRGTWYSSIFGRVGPFELRKEGLPALPADAKRIERLSGLYRGPSMWLERPEIYWAIRLQVVPGVIPAVSENPFFPNTIRGTMMINDLTKAYAIVDGSYDFYTGRFGFVKSSDDTVEHGWIGTQTHREELRLHHVPLPPTTPMPSHEPERFQFVQPK